MLKLKLFFAILLFAVLLNAQVIDRFNKFVLIEDIENAFQTQSRLTLQKKQQYIFDRLIYNITTGDNNLYTYDLANQSMGITKKLTKEQIINDARIIGHPIPTLGRQFESLLIKDTLVLDTICIKCDSLKEISLRYIYYFQNNILKSMVYLVMPNIYNSNNSWLAIGNNPKPLPYSFENYYTDELTTIGDTIEYLGIQTISDSLSRVNEFLNIYVLKETLGKNVMQLLWNKVINKSLKYSYYNIVNGSPKIANTSPCMDSVKISITDLQNDPNGDKAIMKDTIIHDDINLNYFAKIKIVNSIFFNKSKNKFYSFPIKALLYYNTTLYGVDYYNKPFIWVYFNNPEYEIIKKEVRE